ncbi:DUF6351 family protein [Halioxenophilus sp. WMMB6]|uniref:DUF6351 family protein n=1 Tax=Halioxenophilus sp. WMMB6 TaxID=3073815 RepID=UPI00295E3EC6|nr:DUF6351 family protein [Halioxenophilus sp. WMMB6]
MLVLLTFLKKGVAAGTLVTLVLLVTLNFSGQATSGVLFKSSIESMAERCQSIATLMPDDVDITSAMYVEAVKELPIGADDRPLGSSATDSFTPYCSVRGYFEKRVGADKKPYAIGFGLALPDNWNGRFLFQGGGALNGLIREPLGALAAGDQPALFRGFAVVSTDSGHQSDSVFNTDFFSDQQALLNFYSQAVAKVTQLTRKVVAQFYGQQPGHSYFVGCSTGGREAMTMSQRYPQLFDGIIAGAPARRTNYSEVADLWAAKRLRAIMSEGQSAPFSQAQQQLIVDTLLQQCDANDGLRDDMIFAPEGCGFNPSILQCMDSETGDSCLSAEQVSALTEAFNGPRLANGDNVYPGFFFDTGISANKGIPGLLQGVAGPLGRARMSQPFDLVREIELAENFPLAPGNANLTQLSSFAARGSKLMFFHGLSDPWFSAKDTLSYYQSLVQGDDLDGLRDWSRLYLVPGMGHCGGGEQTLDKFDMLSALVQWVEEGRVPASVEASGESFPGRTRPLCAYPQFAYYSGSGNPQSASSFKCR